MKSVVLFLLIPIFLGFQAYSQNCEDAHKKAMLKCSAYEDGIEATALDNIGAATKKRMAERESLKLFSMGRSCAKAQKQCEKVCESALSDEESNVDVTKFIDYQNDCSQGKVAEHRSNLAKRYLNMKDIADTTRDPASSR